MKTPGWRNYPDRRKILDMGAIFGFAVYKRIVAKLKELPDVEYAPGLPCLFPP